MKRSKCLSSEELTLLYYRETGADNAWDASHLAECPRCQAQYRALAGDLDRLPDPAAEIEASAGSRLAARVNERLAQRRRFWLPAFGGALAAGSALLLALLFWQPASTPVLTRQPPLQLANGMNQAPNVDLLEDLELLEDLDTLRQIEGV